MVTIVILARDKFSTLPGMCQRLFTQLDSGDKVIVCNSGYPDSVLNQVNEDATSSGQFSFTILDVDRHSGVNAAWNKATSDPSNEIVGQIENDAFIGEDVIVRAKKFYRGGGVGFYVPIVKEIDDRVHFWPVVSEINVTDSNVAFSLDRGRVETTDSQRASGQIDLFERHCFFMDWKSCHQLGKLDEEMICRTDIDISIQAKRQGIPAFLDPKAIVQFHNIYDPAVDNEFANYRWDITRVAKSHSRLMKKWNVAGYKNTINHAFDIRNRLFGEEGEPKPVDEILYK